MKNTLKMTIIIPEFSSYRIKVDDNNFTLEKDFLSKKGISTKTLGYYSSIEACIKALSKDVVYNDNLKKEINLTDYINQLKEIYNKAINYLN